MDRLLYDAGEVQDLQTLPSRLHSNVEPLSEEEKLKLADVFRVVLPADGPEVIVVSGGVVSAGGGGGGSSGGVAGSSRPESQWETFSRNL